MGLLVFLVILTVNQMVSSAPSYSTGTNDLEKDCPDFLKNDIFKKCLKISDVQTDNISDENKDKFLCTLYFYHLNQFNKKLNVKCNESLIFPLFPKSNETICTQPTFLRHNQSEKQDPNLYIKCIKLCIDWNGKTNEICELIRYYNNFTYNETVSTDNDQDSNKTGNSSLENVLLQVDVNKDNKQLNNHKETNTKKLDVHKEKNSKTGNGKNQNIIENDSADIKLNIVNATLVKNDTNPIRSNNNTIKAVSKQTEPTAQMAIENEDNEDGGPNIFDDSDDNADDNQEQKVVQNDPERMEKPNTLAEDDPVNNLNADMDGKSYFFSYFLLVCILFVMGYIFYHNRVKVMALVLEGKKNKRQHRKGRPNSANYHKLDSNLEEALSSNCNKTTNQIIY